MEIRKENRKESSMENRKEIRKESSMENRKESSMESRKDLRYGYGNFKPSCLQFLNTSAWFLCWMFLCNTFISMLVNGLAGVILTSIEIRFQLTSNETGWVSSAYELGGLLPYIIITLFGTHMHRPRWAGSGILLVSLGSLVFIIPHYTTPVYDPQASQHGDENLCLSVGEGNWTFDRSCDEDTGERSPLARYFLVFIFARLLQGLGVVPSTTGTVTYLDDVTTRQDFAFYISIFVAGGVIGPALGYIIGGFLLSLHTDFPSLSPDDIQITPGDPRWVGAWWLGFLLAAVVLFLSALPFFGYADDLPDGAKIRANKLTEAHNADHNDLEDDADKMENLTLQNIITNCKHLLLNPTYIFLTLYCCTDAFIVTAFTTFGPKYVESQYSVTAGFAGMLFGIIVVPGGAGGTLLGGWLIKRYSLSTSQILKLEIVLTVLLVCTGFMLFITCQPVNFAGINQPYTNSSTVNLTDVCNVDCQCDNVPFSPICGVDNVQYYSPCHAGCNDIIDTDSTKTYHNCSCIAAASPSTTTQPCTVTSCHLMPLFIILFFAAMFFLFMCMSMNTTVTLRCVTKNARSAALGVSGIMGRVLGTVPGPVAFGAAFDWSCIHWQETCGQTGSCISYNNQEMALYIFIFSMGLKILSIFFMVACWWLYKPPVLLETSHHDHKLTAHDNEGLDMSYSNCRDGLYIATQL